MSTFFDLFMDRMAANESEREDNVHKSQNFMSFPKHREIMPLLSNAC